MHRYSEFRILAECRNGYVAECSCCCELNFAYKNILLSFGEEDMLRFLLWLRDSRDCEDNYLPLPHCRDRVYRSPLENFYLTFNLQELAEIEQLLAEVSLIVEARKIIHNGD